MSERIVSAAIHLGGIIFSLPPPARHHTLINNAAQNLRLPTPIQGNQGFLTSAGRFVNRREALHIAIEANQSPKPLTGVDLYSEDLW